MGTFDQAQSIKPKHLFGFALCGIWQTNKASGN